MKNLFVVITSLLLNWGVLFAQCPVPVATHAESPCSGTFTLKATTSNAAVTAHRWYTASTGGTPVAITKTSSPSTSVLVSELTADFTETTYYYVASVCGTTESTSRTVVYYWRLPLKPAITAGNVSASCPGTYTLSAQTNDPAITEHRWYTSYVGGTPMAITRASNPSGSIIISELTAAFTSTVGYYVSAVYCGTESSTRQQVAFLLPYAQVTTANATGCVGTYTLSASTTDAGITGHNWYTTPSGGSPVAITRMYNPSGSQLATELTAPFSSSVTYYVAAVRSDCIGEQIVRRPVTFTLIETTTVAINPAGTIAACQYDNITLTASGGQTGSYKWFANQVGQDTEAISSADSYLYSVLPSTAAGNYKFFLVGTNSCSTRQTVSVSITVTKPCTRVNNYNYSRETVINIPGVVNVSDVGALALGSKLESTTYLDGSGNPIQIIGSKYSPLKNDIVTPVTYDNLGRRAVSYLPIQVTQTTAGNFIAGMLTKAQSPDPANPYTGSRHQLFYQNFTDKIADDLLPYSQTLFENSPQSRAIKQGSVGAGMQPTDGASKMLSYETNVTGEVRRWSLSSSPLPKSTGSYPPGTLQSITSTNEEGMLSKAYYNLDGLKVAEKVKTTSSTSGWAETYYVYDDYNNLCFIFPPEFIRLYPTGTTTLSPSQVNIDNGSFQYVYDKLKRTIQTKSAGTDWVYFIYDARNRPVLSQDGNQRINKEWSYIKYDEFDRPVLSGTYRPGTSMARDAMQITIDGLSGGLGYQNITLKQPAENVFPTSNDEPLVKKYYDNYACEICQDTNYQFVNETWGTANGVAITSNEPFVMTARVKGQLVSSSVKVLGATETTWLNTVVYYNRVGQVIQTISANHLAGYDRISTLIDFAGKIIATVQTPINYNTGGILWLRKRFTYDHTGRVLNIYHQINSQPEVILSAYTYNEVGQVIKKKIHGVGTTPQYLQAVDYRYNIRGLMTSMNNTITSDTGDPADDYFGYNVSYEAQSNSANTPRKDGYISSLKWKHDLSTNEQVYNYVYDDLGRLKGSAYALCCGDEEKDFFTEDGLTYDLNGNIKTLNRYAKAFDGTGYVADQIDALTYTYGTYKDNKLLTVGEGSTSANKDLGFLNGNVSGNDYAYDANGNVTKDLNKKIKSITYNSLNLPVRITFADNTYVEYKYDAAGNRLTQSYVFVSGTGGTTTTTDYLNNVILVDGAVLQINQEEGRIVAPTYSNLLSNREANSLEGFTIKGNVTLTSEFVNGQTYVKGVCNNPTSAPGIFPIRTTKGDSFTVTPGEKYSFKVLGYQAVGAKACLYVKTNKANLVWPGVVLPQGAANENWVTATFTIPSGVTSIQMGILWNAGVAGNVVFVNRVALYKVDYEYQYFLTDHVGSPRVVLQTNPNMITYTATMENENLATESGDNGQFQNISASQLFLFPEGNSTPGGNEVIRLNKNFNVGPSKSVKVYPGDKIDLSVNGYFVVGSTFSKTPVASLITAVAGSFGGVSGAIGEAGSIFSGVNNAYSALGLSPDQGTSTPSAFLNYILFDSDFKPIDGKSLPIPSTAVGSRQLMQMPQVSVLETGYIYVYLSYDNATGGDVYFDDLKIVQTESPVIQVTAYYPYGMVAYSWLRAGENDTKQKFQGKEYNENMGWHDFYARQYDATLGRWLVADPQNQFLSPYVGMGNNPVSLIDPSGEKAWWFGVADILTGGALSTTATTIAATGVISTFTTLSTAYATVQSMIPVVQATVGGTDFTLSMGKASNNLITFKPDFHDLDKTFKIDAGLLYHIPGWETDQALLGNSAAHVRHIFGKVDNVDFKDGAVLVNDNDPSTRRWYGFTLGPYINSQNIDPNLSGSNGEYRFAHEYGHTIQSRILGPLYLSKVAIPSGYTSNFTSHNNHDNSWYEVSASRLGGAADAPHNYRRDDFWYWFSIALLPSYPN